MPNSTLTKAERWIIHNQLEIMRRLSDDDEDRKELELQQVAIARGYIDAECPVDDDDECLSQREADTVYNILSMFQMLQGSYNQLKDKSGIKPDDLEFDGFDGNNEGKLHRFTNHLFKKGDYEGILKKDNNSHMPRLGFYADMLGRYDRIMSAGNVHRLSKEQILAVIADD